MGLEHPGKTSTDKSIVPETSVISAFTAASESSQTPPTGNSMSSPRPDSASRKPGKIARRLGLPERSPAQGGDQA